MKKIALLLVAFSAVVLSCSKATRIPLAYNVETPQGNALGDCYIPDSGTYNMAAVVKFLSGNSTDKVTLVFKGLPADVVPEKDTISGIPTFTANFVLKTNHAAQTSFPVSVVATAAGSAPKHYDFTVHVIPADCASYLWGNYTGSNACTARSYTYTSVASATGTINTLNINNFGGYGTSTNTRININCNVDSLYIPSQNIGNGTVISGYGVFVANQMTLYYTATNTPTNFAETCTAIFNRQ